MKQALLKALAKKKQYYAKKQEEYSDDDSDASLTSDDEDEVSQNVVYQYYDNRYLCLKYLGRGTFCRVWLVYDIEDNDFYAMKVQFPKYYEDSQDELKINKIINNSQRDSRLIKLMNSFVFTNKEGKHTCFIYELMGGTLLDIFKAYEDEEHIPMPICKKIIKELFLSLAELHSLNIIHTDLKPENIMIKKKNKNIDEIVELLQPLNLKNIYEKIVEEDLPSDFGEYNKTKKKKIKKRIKDRSLKKLAVFVEEQINVYNQKNEIIDITNQDIDELQFGNTSKFTDFDIDNLNLKIIDFGNAERLDKKIQDEIMIRNYRPPENIMNDYYDEKADVWSVGCIIYEIFTGDYLFEVDKNQKTIEKDREHLHQMFEILGKIPRNMALDCDFTEDLFDNKGRILKHKNCEYTSLAEILRKDFDYNEEDSVNIQNYLKKVLAYNLKDRYSALEAANDTWLNN